MNNDNGLRKLIESLIECRKFNGSMCDLADMLEIEILDMEKFKAQLESVQNLVWKKTGKTIPLPSWDGIRKESGNFEELCATQTMEHGRNLIRQKLPTKGEGKMATDKKTAKIIRSIEKNSDLLNELQ